MALADCEEGLLARILGLLPARRARNGPDSMTEEPSKRLFACVSGHAEPLDWLCLLLVNRSLLAALRRFLARLSELRLVGHQGLALAQLGPGQVKVLSCEALTFDPLPTLCRWRLETLRLTDCDGLSDASLQPLLASQRLRCLDLSWSRSFTDAPFAHLRPELRELRLVGCQHLTERLLAHLAHRCEAGRALRRGS